MILPGRAPWPHHGRVLLTDAPTAPVDEHRGLIAGRYRDGALSDGWTDVTRCAWGTFTAYVATCRCGWRGTAQVPDARGADRCRWQLEEHLAR